jgi:hypothetical protein
MLATFTAITNYQPLATWICRRIKVVFWVPKRSLEEWKNEHLVLRHFHMLPATCYSLHTTPPTAQCSTTGYSLLSTGYSLLSTNYILYLLSTGKVNWLTSNYWPFITRYCNSGLFTANWLLTRVGKIWSSKGTCRYQNYLNQRTKSL